MSTPSVLELTSELTLGACLGGTTHLAWDWTCTSGHATVRSDRPISHIEPLPLAMLAAWADFQLARGVKLTVEDSVKSEYSWKYGLLSVLSGRPAPPAGPNAHFFPPTPIRTDQDRQLLLEQVAPLLKLQDGPQRNALRECLSEILRNVAEHADSPRGAFVCVSYFPGVDRVSIAVVDTGVGVPTTIRRRHAELSDAAAVNAALQYGVTGSRSERPFAGSSGTVDNAGLGLYMVRSAATLSGGLFALVSENGFARSDRLDDIETGSPASSWNGTAVAVTFRPSQAPSAWQRRMELMPKPDRKKELISWGPGPTGCTSIQILPTVGHLAEDKEVAKRVRDEVLLPALRQRTPVCVDLRQTRVVTHTFMHALLYEAIGVAGADVGRLVHVYAKDRQVKDVVRMVSLYADEDAQGAAASE